MEDPKMYCITKKVESVKAKVSRRAVSDDQ